MWAKINPAISIFFRWDTNYMSDWFMQQNFEETIQKIPYKLFSNSENPSYVKYVSRSTWKDSFTLRAMLNKPAFLTLPTFLQRSQSSLNTTHKEGRKKGQSDIWLYALAFSKQPNKMVHLYKSPNIKPAVGPLQGSFWHDTQLHKH